MTPRNGLNICALAVMSALAALLGACATAHRAPPPRPAPINHVVFLKLKDQAQAGALIEECDARLATIPGVASYHCGRHLETGRPTVEAGYDVGLAIGFNSAADYTTYVDHPNHTSLVAEWQPRLEWIRVFDILDESP